MRHSLRLRLIAVNAILPMLTIAAAGWFIRDANVATFNDGSTFSVPVAGTAAVDLQAYSVNGTTSGGAGRVGPGTPDGEPVFTTQVVNASGWQLPEECRPPDTVLSTTTGFEVQPLDANAIPIVYSAGQGTGSNFLVVGSSSFVNAFEADKNSALDSLNFKVAIAIGLAGLVCGIVGMAASERILGPVQALTGAARRLESGDLSQRVEHRGKDEIGQLSHAFNAMAESLQRTESLRKTMTSDVAHELRTPLNNIAGFVDMLADGLVEPDERVLTTLQDETQLLVTLVDDLEQLSIGDAGRLALDRVEVPLAPVVDRAAHAMSPRANDRGITLAVVDDGERQPVAIDVTRIDQVLRNLAENAIRHTPEGGTVTFRVALAGSFATIAVEDSGPGIDPAHLPFIFERFYRADSSRTRRTGGSGLGLAIARQIVEAHGGVIIAENRAEGGARFVVRLPLPPG